MIFSSILAIWFCITILVSTVAMKLISMNATGMRSNVGAFVFLSPVFSTVTWVKKVSADQTLIIQTLIRTGILFFPFALSRWFYLKFVPDLHPDILLQCYLALIPLYCMGQFASSFFQVLYLPTGWIFPAHFQYPPLSKSLSEFWGMRWASWVADWLRQIIFNRYRERPKTGLMLAFFISGLWHELLINVPLYIFCGVNEIGSMLIYFGIQALAILGERKFLRNSGYWRHLYAWTVILVPAPLVMNEGVLRMVGFFISS